MGDTLKFLVIIFILMMGSTIINGIIVGDSRSVISYNLGSSFAYFTMICVFVGILKGFIYLITKKKPDTPVQNQP